MPHTVRMHTTSTCTRISLSISCMHRVVWTRIERRGPRVDVVNASGRREIDEGAWPMAHRSQLWLENGEERAGKFITIYNHPARSHSTAQQHSTMLQKYALLVLYMRPAVLENYVRRELTQNSSNAQRMSARLRYYNVLININRRLLIDAIAF